MKIQVFGMVIDGQFCLNNLYLHKETANVAAYQAHYDRFYKSDVQLVKCNIEYKKIKQISQAGKLKLKKRKKLRKN